MKCIEIEKDINLLFDGDVTSLPRQEIAVHLGICNSCRTKFESWQTTKGLLKQQATILPGISFDDRMLRAFDNKLNAKPAIKESWLTKFFAIPKPALALMLALFAVGLGLAFFFGRISVSSQPQSLVTTLESTEVKPIKPTEKVIESASDDKSLTQTKVVTKYVEVPLVKEKVVERIVYINKSTKPKPNEEKNIKQDETNDKERTNVAKHFSLKDLQPVENVTYKIIRRGENNE